MDGQLEQCPLTIKELYTIVDSFTDTLLGIYHHRIEYPGVPSRDPRSEGGGGREPLVRGSERGSAGAGRDRAIIEGLLGRDWAR